MFESQSNTPAEQDSTTPSTNEQYLTLAEAVLKVASLEQQVKNLIEDRDNWQKWHGDLEAQLVEVRTARDNWCDKASERLSTIERAREAIEEVLAGDVNPQSTFDDFQTAFELLGVSLNREVEIEVTVTWRGTINLPSGMDPEDLDIDDFGIEINGHNEYESEFYNGMHDYQISER